MGARMLNPEPGTRNPIAEPARPDVWRRESAVALVRVPEIVPGRPDVRTVRRWAVRGVRGVTLETFCRGGRRWTSKEALDRFFEAIGEAKAFHHRGTEDAEEGRGMGVEGTGPKPQTPDPIPEGEAAPDPARLARMQRGLAAIRSGSR